ncbi:MAG TPA: hypothetical protein VFE91_01610 [Nitrososphaerales archaeon]|nr:hypothetical protein [Nitrososphaerales archaeon]
MKAKKWIAVIAILAVLALFVPFVPQTQSSGQVLGAHYAQTVTVSPSYYAFHCGSYLDSRVSLQLGSGYTGFYQLTKGYSFSCNYNNPQ